ncbi:MAG: hypothetical protein OIN83_03710 [Candidatus Methanoperedens sp.]|nr:hypothetical protein [Candidatus Methanoperedens sp.]
MKLNVVRAVAVGLLIMAIFGNAVMTVNAVDSEDPEKKCVDQCTTSGPTSGEVTIIDGVTYPSETIIVTAPPQEDEIKSDVQVYEPVPDLPILPSIPSCSNGGIDCYNGPTIRAATPKEIAEENRNPNAGWEKFNELLGDWAENRISRIEAEGNINTQIRSRNWAPPRSVIK